MRMRKMAVAGVAALTLLLAACGGDDGDDAGTDGGNGGDGGNSAEGGKIGVLLPDAATSPRWENNDRPALDKAISDAGYEAIIQNASKDVTGLAWVASSKC